MQLHGSQSWRQLIFLKCYIYIPDFMVEYTSLALCIVVLKWVWPGDEAM